MMRVKLGRQPRTLYHSGSKAAWESGKAGQNVLYKGEHDACEAGKASQNAIYMGAKGACESGKVGQNVAYKADHDACEVAKTTSKATCELQKAVDTRACMVTNVYSGDLIGPMGVNLFRRAMNESPIIPLSTLPLPPVNIGTGRLVKQNWRLI